MFYLTWTKVMEERSPAVVLFQIIGHVLANEDVPGIAAIHHSLRQVDPGAGDVFSLVHIHYFIYRAAVNPHPQRN